MQIIFLDQNKWVDLARVLAGTSQVAEHTAVYDLLRTAVADGRLLAPLTITQIIETSKQNRPERRRWVAQVQAELSRGYVYRSRKVRLDHEIIRAACLAFGELVEGSDWRTTIVPGFYRAFEPMDTPEEIARWERLNQILSPAQQYLDFTVNQDDERRRHAIANFTTGTDALLERIEKRREMLEGADADLRYRAYAAQLFSDHQQIFARLLAEKGRSIDDLFGLGGPAVVKFLKDIPTLHVEAEIAVRLEIQERPLHGHDPPDVQSFYTAVPYSDVVVSERLFVSLARQAKLDKQYGLRLLTNLEDLLGLIPSTAQGA
jgi:hypothetical protein